VRYVASGGREPGPWYEIVGVVRPLGMIDQETPGDAGLYHPVAAGGLAPLRVAVHLDDDPRVFVQRLREITADIDPAALIDDPMPLSEVLSADRALIRWATFAVVAIAGIAIVLSVASLYALMSFTVAQRTREIGLRSALGADPTTIVSVVARRALVQLSLGVLIGVIATVVLLRVTIPAEMIAGWPLALAGAAGIVLLVGMLACVAPTLRGLRIRPMDALRT
jgi:putative ABC transport system permease protein